MRTHKVSMPNLLIIIIIIIIKSNTMYYNGGWFGDKSKNGTPKWHLLKEIRLRAQNLLIILGSIVIIYIYMWGIYVVFLWLIISGLGSEQYKIAINKK